MDHAGGFTISSDFRPLPGEANFGPPLPFIEVTGGAHIAPEVIAREGEHFLMTVWPQGLDRHDAHRTVRFPHGLMMFGETLEETARRLIVAQLCAELVRCRVVHVDSYVDESGHWHRSHGSSPTCEPELECLSERNAFCR